MLGDLVKWFDKRRWRVAAWMGACIALAAMALILPPLIESSHTIVETDRYASICTRCGVQTAEDFYMVLGTEVLRCEKILGASKITRLQEIENCTHETALIGRSLWQLHKNFDFGRVAYGKPKGWIYQGEELPKHLLALAAMRPGESVRYIDALTSIQTNAPVQTNTARASVF